MTIQKLLVLMTVGIAFAVSPVWAEDEPPSVNTMDIGKMTCKQLMGGNDLDREVGIAFFHGYFAGKENRMVVDLPAASELSTKVRDYCLSNPDSTIMNAFAKSSE